MAPRRLAGLLVVAALAAALSVRAFRVAVVEPIRFNFENRGCTDFDGFFFGAKLVRWHGKSYYDYPALTEMGLREANRQNIPVVTSPVFSTVPYMPLITLPYAVARVVWHLFTVLALGAGFLALRYGLGRALPEARGRRADVGLGLLFLTTVAWHRAVEFHFCQGQTNIHMMALLAGTAAFAVSDWRWRDAACGALMALAVLSKVFPAIVLPLFFMMGRWRVLLWTGAFALTFVAVTLPLTGIADYVNYPSYFSGTFYFGDGIIKPINLAFKRFWLGWFADWTETRPWLKPILSAAVAAPVAYGYLMLWIERRRAARQQLGEGVLKAHFFARFSQTAILIGCIMASYWEYHMVTSFVALAMMAVLLAAEPRSWKLPGFALVLALVLAAIPYEMLEGSRLLGEGGFALARCTALVVTALAMEVVTRRILRRAAAQAALRLPDSRAAATALATALPSRTA